MLKVTFDVYGIYTRGRLLGKVNPSAHTTMVFYGEDVKTAVSKLAKQTEGSFYKIKSVEEISLSSLGLVEGPVNG